MKKTELKKILKKNIIDMQKKKTGELFGFCCESVAIVKGLNYQKRKKLKELGVNIGLFCSTPMVAVSRKINRKPICGTSISSSIYYIISTST